MNLNKLRINGGKNEQKCRNAKLYLSKFSDGA